MLKPKLFSIMKHRDIELTKNQLTNDIIAGVIVAIIALPLSVALAIASGVTPEKGLITAIIAGFLISFLGGSRVQIGGPTGAFVVIVYGIVEQYGITGLTIATLMAGIFMVFFGLMKFGSVIKFVPYPTTTGFTSGIAIVLLSTQVKDFLGLEIENVPSEFFEKWEAYIKHFSTIDIATSVVGLISILIIVLWPKVNKKIPGSLISLLVVTLGVKLLGLPVETIGSRFGEISNSIELVNFSQLNISIDLIKSLLRPAMTIAFLASIESLLSAVVADGMIGKKHNSNMELIAQGIANIASALFGGIPATGAIARTAECAGVDAIVIPKRESAQINADAIKTSAGALHKIPVCKVNNLTDTVMFLQSSGLKIVGCTEKTDDTIYDPDYKSPLAIVMGSEEKGISNQILKICDNKAKIPMSGEISSLNVSVAAGIILYEAVKQRI